MTNDDTAPTPDAGSDLAKLSSSAAPGPWFVCGDEGHESMNAAWFEGRTIGSEPEGKRIGDITPFRDAKEGNAHFVVAVVNAYRSGRLVEAPAPTPDAGSDLAKLSARARNVAKRCLQRADMDEEISKDTLTEAATVLEKMAAYLASASSPPAEDLAGQGERARHQRDLMFSTLHKVGVAIGLIDGAVACDGPQLIAAMEEYCDHLASSSAPDLAGQGESGLEPCCDAEIKAWEQWATGAGFDMHEHPLHYLFLDEKTAAARKAWKAALEYAAALAPSQPPVPDLAGQGEPVAWKLVPAVPTKQMLSGWIGRLLTDDRSDTEMMKTLRWRYRNMLHEAPAPSRPADREEIAKKAAEFRAQAKRLEGAGSCYSADLANAVADAYEDALALFAQALRDAPRNGGDAQ